VFEDTKSRYQGFLSDVLHSSWDSLLEPWSKQPEAPKAEPKSELQMLDEILDSENGISCESCKVVMKGFDKIMNMPTVLNKTEDIALKICLKYLSYGDVVCTEMIDRMAPIIVDSLTSSMLSANYMCAELLGVCSSPVYTKEYASDYAAAQIASKPEFIQDNNYINNLYA
jgi:hypothetical protein